MRLDEFPIAPTFALELSTVLKSILKDYKLTQQALVDMYELKYDDTKPTMTREYLANIATGKRYPSNQLLRRLDEMFPTYNLTQYLRIESTKVYKLFADVHPRDADHLLDYLKLQKAKFVMNSKNVI